MRLYLAGPMRGKKRWGFDRFHEVTAELRGRGYIVISPAEIDEAMGLNPDDYPTLPPWFTIEAAMKRDFAAISRSDAVVLLEGWEESVGANQEIEYALANGKMVFFFDSDPANPSMLIRHPDSPRALPPVRDVHREVQEGYGDRMEVVSEALANGQTVEIPWDGEVRVVDAETGGEKGQKLARLGAVDPNALTRIAEVAGYGCNKYARYNFLRGYDWSLSYDALQRHLAAFWSGQAIDPESQLPHLAHAGWHCLTLLSFSERALGTDDRYKQETA